MKFVLATTAINLSEIKSCTQPIIIFQKNILLLTLFNRKNLEVSIICSTFAQNKDNKH